jgi:hypothetical protein
MKTGSNRFHLTSRSAAFVLACLLLAPAHPSSGQISLRIGPGTLSGLPFGSSSKKLAGALAKEVRQVLERFDRNRRALPTVKGPGGEPAHPRQEVAGLIALAEKDLDQAIEGVGEPGLAAMQFWAAEEFRRIRDELAAAPGGQSAASFFAPRAVAVVASVGGGGAVVRAASAERETLSAKRSRELLDEVAQVIERIFFLSSKNDIEVDLWVGSTPAQQVMFSFWPQGSVKGSPAANDIIRTNGKRERVMRGLYSYRAAYAQGPVTEFLQYPSQTASQASQSGSARLDLVNGSRFFCCRFEDKYCHHVDDQKECRAGGR